MRLATRLRRRVARFLTAFGLVMLGLLATGPGQVAWGQTKTTCSPASVKGVDGPIDYGAYCWIDFTGLTVTQNGSQDFVVTLPGGVATLTFTLTVDTPNTHPIEAHAVPTWTGAAFGNFAFNGISGEPVIYQTNNVGGATTTVTLTNVKLNANGTSDLPFVFVAADGESTNDTESLAFTTSGDPWELVASPGENEVPSTPKLTYSNGNTMVTETGAGSGDTASYVFTTNKFTTNNIPFTVTAKMHGSGLQGVIFGVKYHTIGLSLTKTHDGEFKAGGIGSYTINVANTVVAPTINPPTDPQPVQVVDNLPTGLTYASASGNGWSCSAVGQIVTCNTTSLQDLTTSKPFQPITVVVNVDNDAPATLTNNATVTDPTTSTLVFNVCEVAANGVCPGSATSTDGDDTTILHSNLSTSTKTVVDTNGGDTNPGDTLEYTITLKETGGVDATGVSITDDMPQDVAGLTLTSPTGISCSTTSSTCNTTGGANGTGQLDITGITVPANGSVTFVYNVTVDAAATPGDIIVNTATITNPDADPSGSTTKEVKATITVTQPAPPASGNKILYVYDDSTMSRAPQTTTSGSVSITTTHDWILTPALQKKLTIDAPTISVNLLVQCESQHGKSGNCASSGSLHFTASLFDTTAGTQIGGPSNSVSFASGTPMLAGPANIPVTSAVDIPAGHQLVLRVTNTAGSSLPMLVTPYDGTNRSTVKMAVSTVINVDSVQTYDNDQCTGSPVTPVYEINSTVFICAVVSDPFGSADIDPSTGGTAPTITITEPDGTTKQVDAVDMTLATDSGAATKTFIYHYTPNPASLFATDLGDWTVSVTATEGTPTDSSYNGGTTITHTGKGRFVVGAPDLVVVKSVSAISDPANGSTNAKAIPGATMQYLITITNQGNGAVDSNQPDDPDALFVTDAIPSHTAFVVGSVGFIDGSASSGSTPSGLTLDPATNVSYSNDGGATWTNTPVGTVTNLRFSPQGSMNGKRPGADAPACTITFKVKIQ